VKSWHIATGLFAIVGIGFVFGNPGMIAVSYSKHATTTVSSADSIVKAEAQEHLDSNHILTPEVVKAIYMSSCVVGTPSFRDELVQIADETEINAIVIDVKDFSGTLSYKPDNPELMHAWEAANCGARDMREFLQTL